MLRFLYVGSDQAKASQLLHTLQYSAYADCRLSVASSLEDVFSLLAPPCFELVFIEDDFADANLIERLKEHEQCLPTILLRTANSRVEDKVSDHIEAVDSLAPEELDESHLARSIRFARLQRQSWLDLRSVEQRRRAVMENSSQGIWRIVFEPPIDTTLPEDEQISAMMQSARLVECNDSKARMYGYAHAQELVERRFRNVTPEQGSEFREFLRQFIRSNYRISDAELQENDKEGNPKYFRNNLTGILSGQSLHELWGVQSDISADKATEAMQSRLAAIVASSKDAILSISTTGILQTWNRGAEEMFGYSADEAVGQRLTFYIPPEHLSDVTLVLDRINNGQGLDQHETQRICKDGSLIDISLSVAPIFDSAGRVIGASGIVRDIIEQKRTLESLKYNENLYHTIAANFPNGSVYLLDLNGYFLLAEGQGLAPIGLSSEMVVGKTVAEVFGETEVFSALQAAFTKAAMGEDAFMEAEIEGRIRSTYIIPVRSDSGIVTNVLCMTQDVTEQKRSLRALERSEKLYATLASNFPNGSVLLLDRDLRVVLAEGRGLAQLGIEAKSIIGQSLAEVFNPISGAEEVIPLYRRALEGQEANGEFELAGTHRWIHVVPIRENGEVTGVMGMSQNISALKNTEHALRASEELNRAVLDSMQANIVVLDQQGNITAVNEPWRQFARENGLCERSFSSFGVGANYLATCHDTFGDNTEGAIEAANGIREVLAGQVESFALEYPCHYAEQKRWYQMIVTPLSSTLGGVVVAHVPITERKQAELAVRSSEERLRTFLDNTPATVFIINDQGHYVYLNKAINRFVGQPVGELLGKTVFDRMPQPWAQQARDNCLEVLESQQAKEFEEIIPGSDGTLHHHIVAKFPVNDVDGQRFIAGVGIDITDRKRAEQELQRSQEQLKMAQSMAHLGHIQYDASLNKSFWSDEFFRILGLEPRSVEPNYAVFHERVHPDDRRRMPLPGTHFLRLEETIPPEFRILLPDGQVRWIRGQNHTQRDEYGNLVSFTGTLLDITDLKNAEDERDRFFELSLDMMVISDTNGHFKRVNPAWTRILGYSSDELLSLPFIDFVHPDDVEATIKEASQIYEGHIATRFENRYRCRDGSYKLLEWNSVLHAETDLIYSVAMDITERRRAEIELRESEARFRSMADTAPVLIWMAGPDKACTYFNKTWLEFTGRSLEEELENGWVRGIHAEDTNRCLNIYSQSFDARQAFEMEYRLKRRDGEYRWILDQGVPRFSSNGDFLGYIGTCIDIDDTKRASNELAQSQQRLSGIVNSAMDAIVTIDESMRILVFNPAAERMFGYYQAEVLGQSLNYLIPERFRESHPRHIASFGNTGMTNRRMGALGAINGLRSNGQEFPIEASISQVQLDGQRLFTVILRDITEREQAAEELRTSQERLQVAIQSAQIGLWEWCAGKSTLYSSEYYKKQLGYEEEEFDGFLATYWEHVHPDDRETAQGQFEDMLHAEATHYKNEFRMRHKNGNYRWILSQGTIFRDETGQAYRVLGSHIDITDLKQVEAEIIRSREELQHAHDDLELRVQLRTLELAQANDAIKVESDQRQMALVALQEAVAQLEQARDESERANKELRVNETHLLHGNRIFTELTRLRVAVEEELKDALCSITEAGCELLTIERCSVWLYNQDESAIRCLDLYERLANQHSEGLELSVRDYPRYFHALQMRESIVADEAHKHRATSEFSTSYLAPLGISSMLDTPIIIGGQMVGVLCCEHVGDGRQWKVEDQTFASSLASVCSLALESLERARAEGALLQAKNEAERAREEAVSANQAKSEFLSRMSHELRTPMNSILGFAQILDMTTTDEKQSLRVGHIMKAGRHLLQLINEVLDVARVESGTLSLSPEPVGVSNTVQMAVDLIRPICQQNALSVEIDWNGCSSLYVYADHQRLAQVLLNLLSNAAKYNQREGEIRVRCEQRDGDRLRIYVIDKGQGIEEHYLPKLFMPFERLGREGGPVEGTGLGLALSKRLVEAMGGTINAQSHVGQGSVFWIELPLIHGPQDTLNLSARPSQPIQRSPQAHTILYIEDNVANLQVLEDLLAAEPDIALISAMQGQMGIELARQHYPSLILLDLHLPDIPGEEVLRRLRAEPLLRQVPVIIVSADATPTQRTRLLAAGAAEYLTKPLDLQHFLSVVHKFLMERA